MPSFTFVPWNSLAMYLILGNLSLIEECWEEEGYLPSQLSVRFNLECLLWFVGGVKTMLKPCLPGVKSRACAWVCFRAVTRGWIKQMLNYSTFWEEEYELIPSSLYLPTKFQKQGNKISLQHPLESPVKGTGTSFSWQGITPGRVWFTKKNRVVKTTPTILSCNLSGHCTRNVTPLSHLIFAKHQWEV